MSPREGRGPGRPRQSRPSLYTPKPRKGRTSKIIYFTYRGLNASTGCTNERDALRVAMERARAHDACEVGAPLVEDVLVGDVLDHHLGWVAAHAPGRLTSARARVALLRTHFGRRRVVDLAPGGDGSAYARSLGTGAGGRAARSQASIREDLGELNLAIRTYAEEHPDLGLPRILLLRPDKSPARSAWMSRDEVARVCRVIRGRVWDPAAGDWVRHPPGPDGGRGRLVMRPSRWRRRLRFLLRLTLLAVHSGSRCGVLLRLRWEDGPDHGYLDGATGDLERRGWSEGVSRNKPRTPIRLPAMARVLAERWARNDRAGLDVLSGRVGRPIENVVHRLGLPVEHHGRQWARARAAAGLDASMTFHCLRHTTATWLIEGGATIAEAAAYLGVHVSTLTATYLQVSPHFAEDAAEAMDPRRHNPLGDPNFFGADDPGFVAARDNPLAPRGRSEDP